MTSDLEGFLYQILSITLFSNLKEPVFPFSMLSAKQGACLKLLAFLRSMYTGVSKFTVTLLFSVIGDLVGDDRTLGYKSSTNRNVGYCIVN